MALLKIIKLSNKTWKHNSDVDGDFILTKFYAKQEDNNFLLVESYGSKRRKYLINEIEVYDIGGTAETFANFDDLFLRLELLKYPAFYVDGEFTFDPASYDLTEFQNADINPFVRLDDIIPKDIDTLPAANTPLVGTEPLIVLQDGTLKKVAVSDLSGGGKPQYDTYFQFLTTRQSLTATGTWKTWTYSYINASFFAASENADRGTGIDPDYKPTDLGLISTIDDNRFLDFLFWEDYLSSGYTKQVRIEKCDRLIASPFTMVNRRTILNETVVVVNGSPFKQTLNTTDSFDTPAGYLSIYFLYIKDVAAPAGFFSTRAITWNFKKL